MGMTSYFYTNYTILSQSILIYNIYIVGGGGMEFNFDAHEVKEWRYTTTNIFSIKYLSSKISNIFKIK